MRCFGLVAWQTSQQYHVGPHTYCRALPTSTAAKHAWLWVCQCMLGLLHKAAVTHTHIKAADVQLGKGDARAHDGAHGKL